MMEALQTKHRHEQKDLQSRITQKKKSATKKTRKGVNDECANLETQLKEQQAAELSALVGATIDNGVNEHLAVDRQKDDKHEKIPENISSSLKSISVPTDTVSDGTNKKPNRQKARLARRAAEHEASVKEAEKEAVDLPNLRDQELKSMREVFTSRGLTEHEIRSDGHCMYAAVADQLEDARIGLKPKIEVVTIDAEPKAANAGYRTTREVAAAYISEHPNDFVPFLENPLEEAVKIIRNTGEWGGHVEILALAKAYEVDINVQRADGRVDKIECGLEKPVQQLWLAYYRHSFGLGEHYNSLRRVH